MIRKQRGTQVRIEQQEERIYRITKNCSIILCNLSIEKIHFSDIIKNVLSKIQTNTRYCGGIGRHMALKMPRPKDVRVQIPPVAPSKVLLNRAEKDKPLPMTTTCGGKGLLVRTSGRTCMSQLYIGDWCNGSATDFDSVGRSSILLSPAIRSVSTLVSAIAL